MAGGMGMPQVWEECAGEIQRLGKERAPRRVSWGGGGVGPSEVEAGEGASELASVQMRVCKSWYNPF